LGHPLKGLQNSIKEPKEEGVASEEKSRRVASSFVMIFGTVSSFRF
jgi:hypothetical protein